MSPVPALGILYCRPCVTADQPGGGLHLTPGHTWLPKLEIFRRDVEYWFRCRAGGRMAGRMCETNKYSQTITAAHSLYIQSRCKTQTWLEKLSILLEGEQPLLPSLRWLLCCRSAFRAAAARGGGLLPAPGPASPRVWLLPNVNSNFFKPG